MKNYEMIFGMHKEESMPGRDNPNNELANITAEEWEAMQANIIKLAEGVQEVAIMILEREITKLKEIIHG
jgi:hypothetical protein